MGRIAEWIFEQDIYWFVLDNVGTIMAIAVLLWIRTAIMLLSEVFADDKPLG